MALARTSERVVVTDRDGRVVVLQDLRQGLMSMTIKCASTGLREGSRDEARQLDRVTAVGGSGTHLVLAVGVSTAPLLTKKDFGLLPSQTERIGDGVYGEYADRDLHGRLGSGLGSGLGTCTVG